LDAAGDFLAGAFVIALVFDDLATGLLVVDCFLVGVFLTGALAIKNE
jgi:hypothetical protein